MKASEEREKIEGGLYVKKEKIIAMSFSILSVLIGFMGSEEASGTYDIRTRDWNPVPVIKILK